VSAALPEVLALVDSPELAVLHALEAALAATERALIAAHPELEEGLHLDAPAVLPTEAWLADAVIAHITGLETALFRYRSHLKARGLLRPPGF
jgi:hypothetical protein